MKNTLISKGSGEAKFTIVISPEELEAGKVEVYKRNKDQFAIDGFRKGKAPRSIIEKKYGEGVFLDDAINDVLAAGYPDALKELDIEPIDTPRMEFGKFESGKELEITVTVDTYPEVKLETYKGLEIEKIDGEVTEEDMERELEAARKKNARIISVDRKVQEGDTVILDYKGFVGDEQFAGGTAENHELKIGSGQFIPGFEEQLIGAEKEVEVEVKVTFPEEYHSPDLAGKDAIFKCLVHEVKEEELPELDDEFVQDISEFDTLDEFKKDLKENLEKSKKAWADNQMKDKALEKLVEVNPIDVPEVMIKDEIDNMVRDMNMQLSQSGVNMDMYLSMLGRDMNQLRDEMKPDAELRVKMRMLIRAVMEAEDITVSEEEVNKELELLAIQYGLEVDQIKNMMQDLSFIENDVKMKKAIDIVFDNASVK